MTTLLGSKNTAEGWAAVRAERDARLAACDWIVLSDVPRSALQKAAWLKYRQQLRDITKVDHIAKVVWPKPPEA